MTEDPQIRAVSDVRELLEISELTDIIFYEVNARRTDDSETPFSMEVMTRSESQLLEVRCRASTTGAGGEYLTDAAAVFTFGEPVELEGNAVLEFTERVGVMAVYPYLRESVTQSAAKLGLDRPVLPLLRAGDVKLDKPQQPTD